VRASIACPKTDSVVDFEAPGGETTLSFVWESIFEVECPACGGKHDIPCATAYKQGVMAQHDLPIEDASILH
jgi:hypothetical protein